MGSCSIRAGRQRAAERSETRERVAFFTAPAALAGRAWRGQPVGLRGFTAVRAIRIHSRDVVVGADKWSAPMGARSCLGSASFCATLTSSWQNEEVKPAGRGGLRSMTN